MGQIILKSLQSYAPYPSEEAEKYFGSLPNIDLESGDEIIKCLKNSELFLKHPFHDERIRSLPDTNEFKIRRFFGGYHMKEGLYDSIYKFFYNNYIENYIWNNIREVEMVMKTNLKYLVSNEQRSRRIENKINMIFDNTEQDYLYYLNLYNEDQTELYLKGFHRMDCAIELCGSKREENGFNNWNNLFFKYFKGEYPKQEEISSLSKWRKLAVLDIELKYYNELLKNLSALSNVDYFNSISQLNTYKDLNDSDQTFYLKIKKHFKEERDVSLIFKILLNTDERSVSYFKNLFRFFYSLDTNVNRFKFIGHTTFENIINSCYSELQPFKIGTNPLANRWKDYFKSFEK
jgi:hypothetical protein